MKMGMILFFLNFTWLKVLAVLLSISLFSLFVNVKDKGKNKNEKE